MMKKAILFLLLLCLNFSPVRGYHIAGGDLTSTWLGGNTYEVKLTLFRDCSNPLAANFDPVLYLGIFVLNSNSLYDTLTMRLDTSYAVGLTGNACSPPPAVCLEIGYYTDTLTLPSGLGPMYLIWERCCRNQGVVNLDNPNAAGLAFYLEIPDGLWQNSSPQILSEPTPYTCVDQFTQISFEAFDPDGDSLVYRLATPLNGGNTSNQDPNPFSPSGGAVPVAGPYNDITWAFGYSLQNLFASSNPSGIDAQTGIFFCTPENSGLYAIAVEIDEYRNGIKIGTTRRELELTVIVCTGNAFPALLSTAPTTQLQIYAGDSLSFTVSVNDSDGDSVFLRASGELFANDPVLSIDPPFAVFSPAADSASAQSDFTWYTQCGQERDSSYKIVFRADDNGCPIPLTRFFPVEILVKKVPAPNSPEFLCSKILGPDLVRLYFDTLIQPQQVSSLVQYTLYRSTNGGAYSVLTNLNTLSSSYYDDSTAYDLSTNRYCYTMSASNRCGEFSAPSDTICSDLTINPDTNYIRSVTVNEQGQIELRWAEFKHSEEAQIHISVRLNEAGSVVSSAENLIGQTQALWIDENRRSDRNSWCYTLKNTNICGYESVASNEACSILLKGKSKLFRHELNWTEYLNWRGMTESYELQRAADPMPQLESQALFPSNRFLFEDTDLPDTGGRYTYRIKAQEGPGSYDETSFSNVIELFQAPFAWLPNAFSPNKDALNEDWGLSPVHVRQFELSVFNRYGQPVFQSNNINQRWDGNFGGQPAPQGVYVYRLVFSGYESDELIEKRGTVTLVR